MPSPQSTTKNLKSAHVSRITFNGQITLPKSILLHLGLKPGDKLAFTTLSDGRIVLRAKTRLLVQLAGSLTRAGQPSVLDVKLLSMPAAAEFEP